MQFRKNLNESLEEYAARFELPPSDVRYTWRLQGLRFLFAENSEIQARPLEDFVPLVSQSDVRVAPGIAVPTATPEYPERDPL